MIMSAILSAPIEVQRLVVQFWSRPLVATLKRQWVAYQNWHIPQQAIARLGAMSDAQLKDIGLVPAQIETAARVGMSPE
jgi:uncharacterized protein YjiS (DUF1127 family)